MGSGAELGDTSHITSPTSSFVAAVVDGFVCLHHLTTSAGGASTSSTLGVLPLAGIVGRGRGAISLKAALNQLGWEVDKHLGLLSE